MWPASSSSSQVVLAASLTLAAELTLSAGYCEPLQPGSTQGLEKKPRFSLYSCCIILLFCYLKNTNVKIVGQKLLTLALAHCLALFALFIHSKRKWMNTVGRRGCFQVKCCKCNIFGEHVYFFSPPKILENRHLSVLLLAGLRKTMSDKSNPASQSSLGKS